MLVSFIFQLLLNCCSDHRHDFNVTSLESLGGALHGHGVLLPMALCSWNANSRCKGLATPTFFRISAFTFGHFSECSSPSADYSRSSDEDMRTSLAIGTISLKLGLLRLSQWSKDFNKYSQCPTYAQVREYSLEITILEIARAIGIPLIIDAATQKRTFGHYARVLVDIDFSRHLF